MENCSTIMAILQERRTETAVKVQDILTKYGCFIRVRLGLHDSRVDQCANTGIILLQMCGDDAQAENLKNELMTIENVKVKYMKLDF